ncbi:hypothetical protein ABW20_dc0104593 [Dactylellina cionopaga]|nr:hypothetical protein ABW20_dc0104593 [Dactylellina cionopaga]
MNHNHGTSRESYDFGIDLGAYSSVKEWSRQIYLQVRSGNMPMTEKKEYLFPKDAVDRLYLWITQGCREKLSDPVEPKELKFPAYDPPPFRIRKDIASLTQDELDLYRSKLDDILQVDNPNRDSPWQNLCYIHTDWCLHYQEGFLPWHRAHLMYMESLIDCGIPYWNWMAVDASDPESKNSGLPQAFLDENYIHPTKGERPNPLRAARAKDGKSKDKSGSAHVVRAPELTPGACATPEQRSKYIKIMKIFQVQVVDALKQKTFSIPQCYLGLAGYPWTNIPEFHPPQKLEPYLFDMRGTGIGTHFDNLFEQPHDNFHGWIGPGKKQTISEIHGSFV